MKKWTRFGAAAILALTLCAVSGALLLACMRPMENRTCDLSLFWEGEAIPEGWVYDQKGWTVFTQEGDAVTELVPDGYAGFTGLGEFGQTFYFSRVMTEQVDSPILRLEPAERNFAVFLDGDLLYTDCPELDNRIGYLRLPVSEWFREEPVLVTLPRNYAGKTLTIAQSTDPDGGELQEPDTKVWPCVVTLYCGYAYESALVAESFQTAVPAALAFAAGTLLLGLFLWQAWQGRPVLDALCGGLLACFWLAGRLALSLLPNVSFGPLPVDAATMARELSLTLLLVFLGSRLTKWRRAAVWVFAGAQGAAAAALAVMEITEVLTLEFMMALPVVGLAGVSAALVCGTLEWKRSWFYRVFCPLTAAGAVLWAALGYWRFDGRSPGMLLYPLAGIMTAAALFTALAEAVRREITRRTEARLLAQRQELTQASYEAMRRQNEQVMMLRHDMVKHFLLLRQTTGDEKTAAYLDELIGKNEKIRPVVQSGNEMLDVILNGKLSAAADAGIAVEIARMEAPDKLPLSDAELCSLMMNLLDNAVEGASATGVERPYIKLHMGVTKHFFLLYCENSTTLDHIQKETAPGHGLGMKIIKQIVARYEDLLDTEYGTDHYSVKLAIPLD
ncbi:MAG: ATP-binding protein [Oscillospiraceae bacterium]|nr:ATP-binding protein [Oscillospiraceae bacterium]